MKHLMRLYLAAVMSTIAQVGAASPDRGLANVSPRISRGWDLSADALAWYASEQTSAVWADILNIGENTSSFTAENLPFDWTFGFRVGAGYNLEYDQWDTQIYWTWFRTKVRQMKQVVPEFIPVLGGVLVTESIEPEFFAAALTSDTAQRSHIRWTVLFNMFDWELGRCYWVSKGLSLRPFVGLKGGWIDQSIHLSYDNLIINSAPTANSGREQVKNNFWGLGPVGGVDTKWKLRHFGAHFPSLFGDFSAATMWGTWICSDAYNDTTGKKIAVKTRNSMLGALMLRGFMGAGWDVDFKGGSHVSTRLGYEMQLWVNQLRVATIQLERLHGDLTLQGVTFNCQCDF